MQPLILCTHGNHHGIHGVVVVQDFDVGLDLLRELCQRINILAVEHRVTLICTIGVMRDGAQVGQIARNGAIGRLHQRVRLVGHHHIPLAAGQRIVIAQVGISRDDDAAARALGVLQLADVQAQRHAGINPVGGDLVVRHHNQDVVLALARHALDHAQAGEGLARARAVGEQHAVAVRLGEAGFCLEHVLLLAFQQIWQRGLDVVQVARLDRDFLGFALLRGLG